MTSLNTSIFDHQLYSIFDKAPRLHPRSLVGKLVVINKTTNFVAVQYIWEQITITADSTAFNNRSD